jgi:hypothetical protein
MVRWQGNYDDELTSTNIKALSGIRTSGLRVQATKAYTSDSGATRIGKEINQFLPKNSLQIRFLILYDIKFYITKMIILCLCFYTDVHSNLVNTRENTT